MRIDKITLKGLTTYKDEQALDLAALGPGVIAVAGPNGSGKTTLLEAIPGAIYRQTPSRGSVASIATARDARIELVGENGAPFRIQLDVDAHNGKQEAVIVDAAGEPQAGPKVKDYDKFIAEHFPPMDVYLASFFASQTGVGSVLKMSKADRRELFGQLLGTERLETLAIAARERARAVEADMATSRAALDAIRAGADDVATLEEQQKTAKAEETKAAEVLRRAAQRLKDAEAERMRLEGLAAEAKRAEKAAGEARERAAAAVRQVGRLEGQIRGLEPVLAQAAEIRARAARIQELQTELDQARQKGEEKAAEYTVLQGEATRAGRAYEQANFAHKDADRALRDAEARVEEAASRIEAAKKATAGVPCAGMLEDEKRAVCPALVGHFKTQEDAQSEIAKFNETLEPALSKAFRETSDRKLEADKAAAAANDKLNTLGGELGDHRLKYRKVQEDLNGLKAADRSADLARAEAEKAGLEAALGPARAAAAEAQADVAKYQDLPAAVDLAPALTALESARLDHEMAQEEAQQTNDQVVRLEVQLKTARDARTKADALATKLAPMETELAEWRWLGRGLGREGVQALELDAAGPSVSALANELLADAYGSRFQLRFETQAAKADGKGVRETFDVVVVDTERGREGNGEDLSGGEKVIVGEALGLAVGLFHAQSAGVSLGTVIRDETVGALDPENGERYLAMLRAFLRVGKVHQLLYVAHNPALIELADAVVRIEDGKIEVR